jgi:hypothetical protein
MLPIAVVNVMLAGVWIAMTGGPNG